MNVLKENDLVLIRLQGRLDSEGSANLQRQLSTVDPAQHTLWILDMSHVDFVDSAGLVALIAALNRAIQNKCRLVLSNLHPSVRLILDITQLDQVFEIVDSHAEPAKAAVQNTEPVVAIRSKQAA